MKTWQQEAPRRRLLVDRFQSSVTVGKRCIPASRVAKIRRWPRHRLHFRALLAERSAPLGVQRNLGIHLLVAACFVLCLGACSDQEPEGTAFWFSDGRDLWQTTDVRASVKKIRGVDGSESSLQLDARHAETGENLSFILVVPSLVGSHSEVRVFGALAGWDNQKGYARLVPVSSACSSEGEAAFSIEAVDEQARTLTGRFRVNVCGIETDHAWTLGEGRFQDVPY